MRSNFMAGAWIVGIAHFFAATLLAGNASARACMTSAACPHGFQCSGGVCVSLACQSNANCAPGLPCRPDTQCVAGADGSSIPSGACVPQWQALCNVDSDCGIGFQCIFAGGACNCSGSDTNVPPDAGAVSLPCEEVMPPRPPCANANDAGCPSFHLSATLAVAACAGESQESASKSRCLRAVRTPTAFRDGRACALPMPMGVPLLDAASRASRRIGIWRSKAPWPRELWCVARVTVVGQPGPEADRATAHPRHRAPLRQAGRARRDRGAAKSG
jgi:hypothetical protein